MEWLAAFEEWNGMADEGCEVPDGELTDEELNPRENENADESGGEVVNAFEI